MQKCICVGSFLCATALNVHLVEYQCRRCIYEGWRYDEWRHTVPVSLFTLSGGHYVHLSSI